MKKIVIYWLLIIVSAVLIAVSLTFLGNTQFIAPILIGLSVYLMIGSLIKLCKTNEKLKNIFSGVFDLLFWLP